MPRATPGPPPGRTRRGLEEIRRLVRRYRGALALGLALIIVNRLAALVLPIASKYVIDEVIGKHRQALLFPIVALALASIAVQAITTFGGTQVLGVAAQRAITQLRRDVQAHVLRLPVAYFESTQSGVLITRIMTDAESLRPIVGTGFVQLASSFLTAVLAVGILLYMNWWLTVIVLAMLVAFAVGTTKGFAWLRTIFRRVSEQTAFVTGRLGEALGGIAVVKTYTAERREALAFTRNVHQLLRLVARSITGVAVLTAAITAITGLVTVLLMVVGVHAIDAGTMTLGDLTMYVFLVSLLVSPLVQIAALGSEVSRALAGLDRIRELRELVTEDRDDAARAPITRVAGTVEVCDVSFEYVPGEPVLRHVSFVAPAGSTTALVGPSGSGKSTLCKLLLTFADPTVGRVLVDGHDLARVRRRDYRAFLGVVLQDNFLFDGTIADNIRYGRPGATLEEIRAVSRLAHCDEFVSRLPDGYDTVVGERGVKLSGGQRQRIAIARAMLADPRILILDEATSNLDSESEALIQDGLRALRRGRTTFVIAHRLSTIQNADQILVLDEGRIVERGTHAELLAANGRYRTLHDVQYRPDTSGIRRLLCIPT